MRRFNYLLAFISVTASACRPGTPSESLGEANLRQRIDSGKSDRLQLVSFRKTDGQLREEGGVKGYEMDFTAEAEFVRNGLYSTGGPFSFGTPVAAIATADLAASYSRPARGFSFGRYANQLQGNRAACRGDRLKLNGSLDFSLKESGWRPGHASITVRVDSANRKENCLASNASQPSGGATSAPNASGQTGIAIQNSANTRDQYYIATMKSDLRNMATYEEQYSADNGGVYFSGTAAPTAPLQGFRPSQNVRVSAVGAAGPPPSYTLTATHTQTAKTCTMTNGLITCT